MSDLAQPVGRNEKLRNRPPRFQRRAWYLVLGVQGAVVLATVVPAWVDQTSTLVGVLIWFAFVAKTLTVQLALVLACVAVWALCLRRWKLALSALPLGLVVLLELSGVFASGQVPVAGNSIRLLSANVWSLNETPYEAVAAIVEADADVVVIHEYTPRWQAILDPALAAWQHRLLEPRLHNFGTAIYSKLPLLEADAKLELGALDYPACRVVIEIEGQPVALYAVHLLPPRKLDYLLGQRRQLRDLSRWLIREKLPSLVVGDFNFTQYGPYQRVLTGLGLREAHALAGGGLGSTWPVLDFLPWFPGFRIDHIYLSSALTCSSLRTGSVAGSDHYSLVAEVGLAAAASEPARGR